MGAEPQTSAVSEIAQLRDAIDRAATATEVTLAAHAPAAEHEDLRPRMAEDLRPRMAERKELSRQIGALRERVALAEGRNEGPMALRAELATLLSFARTLEADADRWRAAGEERDRQLQRQRVAALKEQEGQAAERVQLAHRRDALQSTILRTAARMARENRGECRRTMPVVTLGEGLTVCSVSVSCPRRGFRFAKLWLVTLTGSQDVLVRRE